MPDYGPGLVVGRSAGEFGVIVSESETCVRFRVGFWHRRAEPLLGFSLEGKARREGAYQGLCPCGCLTCQTRFRYYEGSGLRINTAHREGACCLKSRIAFYWRAGHEAFFCRDLVQELQKNSWGRYVFQGNNMIRLKVIY